LPGSAGERALRQILEDALRIADRCANPEDRDNITKTVSNLESMIDALCELRLQGKGDSPQAHSLGRGIQQLLRELQDRCQKAVLSTDRAGLKRPAHTVMGKLEQAQRWLANPNIDDNGIGLQAIRLMVADGRKVAEGLQGPKRAELLQLCSDVERLSDQLAELCRKGQGNTPQARAIAASLSQKLNELKACMQDALVSQVADDFMDISTPLKMLSDAALAPFGTPNRESTFEDRAQNFGAHAAKLAGTARMLAQSGGCNDRRTVEGINTAAQRAEDLIPQVVKAARIVLANPNNQASVEHFELVKKQWMDNMEKLRSMLDSAIDTAAFIRANEEGILRDTDRTEQAIVAGDAPSIVNNTSSIARRAHRILQVAQQEADNSEDPQYVARVNDTVNRLRNTIAPMVQNAKGLAQNPRDPTAVGRWRNSNQQLIDAVGAVRKAVTIGRDDGYPLPPEYPPPPDMNQLHISDHAPPRPPLPRDSAPPRPPPPETDDEFETSFPTPQANQPIMMAAHALHMDVKQWSSADNELIAAAKRMALLMAKLSQLVRGEGGTKKD